MPPVAARLVATVAAPLALDAAHAPRVETWPERRLLVQRGDEEIVAYALDELVAEAGRATAVRFPAPWPRHVGTSAVSPQRDLAVFAVAGAPRVLGNGSW